MGALSDAYEVGLLNHLFDKAALTAPTISVGLSTADPGETGAGIAEPVAMNYARVATAAADWHAATGTPTTIDNHNPIVFPTASGAWGHITHAFLHDGTDLIAYGAMTVAKDVGNNDILTFAATNLKLRLT